MSSAPTTVKRKHLALSDHRQTLEDLCHWIDAHLHEPLGWQELMAQSGLDHQTLNALFYKFQSSTPMAWIRKRRELRSGSGQGATPGLLRGLAGRSAPLMP